MFQIFFLNFFFKISYKIREKVNVVSEYYEGQLWPSSPDSHSVNVFFIKTLDPG